MRTRDERRREKDAVGESVRETATMLSGNSPRDTLATDVDRDRDRGIEITIDDGEVDGIGVEDEGSETEGLGLGRETIAT